MWAEFGVSGHWYWSEILVGLVNGCVPVICLQVGVSQWSETEDVSEMWKWFSDSVWLECDAEVWCFLTTAAVNTHTCSQDFTLYPGLT